MKVNPGLEVKSSTSRLLFVHPTQVALVKRSGVSDKCIDRQTAMAFYPVQGTSRDALRGKVLVIVSCI